MEEVSTGTEPRVPAVKPDFKPSSYEEVPPLLEPAASRAAVAEIAEVDKDLSCPICMQIIKDAFLTSCGHSFCYMCIITHLRNKNHCPCCFQFLTNNQLFPNFLLDKLLKKTSARQISKSASPVEQFCRALQQGYEVSIKELVNLLSLLAEKKRKLEQEEAERNMQILLDFLNCLRKQKVDELNEAQTDLQFIKEDINAVERHGIDLYRARDRYSVKLRMLGDDSSTRKPWPSSIDKNSSRVVSSSLNVSGGMSAGSLQNKKIDGKSWVSGQGSRRKDTLSGADSQGLNQSGLSVAGKNRIHAQFCVL